VRDLRLMSWNDRRVKPRHAIAAILTVAALAACSSTSEHSTATAASPAATSATPTPTPSVSDTDGRDACAEVRKAIRDRTTTRPEVMQAIATLAERSPDSELATQARMISARVDLIVAAEAKGTPWIEMRVDLAEHAGQMLVVCTRIGL
jgi:hypothetical protein